VTIFLPLVLLAPALLLLSAVLALASHGPLGWLAAAGLVLVVAVVCRWVAIRTWAWWVLTKAPRKS